jgi:3-deoxy-7-phosphoheptulonate synthase
MYFNNKLGKINMHKIDNLNISESKGILKPKELKRLYPVSNEIQDMIFNSRKTLENILSGKDNRLFVVVGPCSIHDADAALEYAKKLKELSKKVEKELFLIMRVYFEKPRTTIGWKGLINDPYLDDTFHLEDGLKMARKLMLEIADIGLPIGTEALDPISPQYLADLVTWSAIGARTTESQTHREMASGLSSPVGFKNGTDGGIAVAINAMLSASNPHSFLGINEKGEVSIISTKGNKFGHVILRGGGSGPNHDAVSVKEVEDELIKAKLIPTIVIDCSHGNSHKNHNLQPIVFEDVVQQVKNGNNSIKGLMLESNLFEGNQKLNSGKKDELKYGVSITDACIDWDKTEEIVLKCANILKRK